MAELRGSPQVFHGNTDKIDTTQQIALGTRGFDGSGNEYIYLEGVASNVAGAWSVFDEDYATTLLIGNEVGPVGIAMAAILADQYGWYQVFGKNTIASTDTVAADKALYIDGTAGRADDAGVAGDLIIGAYSMSADTSNVATVWLTYPHVSDDIGGSSGTVGGSDTQVQFNDGGTLSGDAGFTYNKTSNVGTIGGLLVSDLTASQIVATDASKNLVSLAVATYPSLTELTYVKGVTSALQTQIDAKAPSTAPTFATSITGSYLTASQILITDASKNIVSAPVATYPSLTELTYLKGVTSAIQTQLGLKYASGDSPSFGTITTSGGIELGHATDTTIARVSAGVVSIEGVTIATATNTLTLSGKTLTEPKIASGGFIADANGNELIIFTTTASAVNELTIANGATTVNPTITASGETNVGINFQAKGTGTYRFLGTADQAAEIRLFEDTTDGTNYSAFKVGTQSADITYTLPTAVGAAGTYLKDAAGNGTLSWATAGGDSFLKTLNFSTIFETSTRFGGGAIASGSPTFGTTGYDIDTTATIDSGARLIWYTQQSVSNVIAGSPTFHTMFTIVTVGTDLDLYSGWGVPASAGSFTFVFKHIGFKVIRNASGTVDLFATQADGTTENASASLTTVAANDDMELAIKINGSTSVDYYWRKNVGSWSAATNLTSNLPADLTDQAIGFGLVNSGVASQSRARWWGASWSRA